MDEEPDGILAEQLHHRIAEVFERLERSNDQIRVLLELRNRSARVVRQENAVAHALDAVRLECSVAKAA